jgi:CheY-like chemotaxis protein
MLAHSGEEAQQVALEQSPDMVIVDMLLADMSGLEVIAGLRSNLATASIPVVMLSAGQELDAPEQAKAAGAEAYLQKPVQIQTLIETIRHFTSNPYNVGR